MWGLIVGIMKIPRSLRGMSERVSTKIGVDSTQVVTTTAAVLMTAGSIGTAEAQQPAHGIVVLEAGDDVVRCDDDMLCVWN